MREAYRVTVKEVTGLTILDAVASCVGHATALLVTFFQGHTDGFPRVSSKQLSSGYDVRIERIS